MINIKNVIIDAWRTGSLVSEYDTPDGSQTQLAVNELNDIIYSLNLDNYLPFTRNTVTFNSNGSDTMTIGSSGCDITGETPILVQKVYCKTASDAAYIELVRISYEEIFGFKAVQTAIGVPRAYSYDRTWPNGRFVFDIIPQGQSQFLVIYNKQFSEININSVIDIPNEYGELFKNMLASVLMRRFKVDANSIALIESNANVIMNKIKKRNSVDKIISWKGNGNESALSRYYNLQCPRQWS